MKKISNLHLRAGRFAKNNNKSPSVIQNILDFFFAATSRVEAEESCSTSLPHGVSGWPEDSRLEADFTRREIIHKMKFGNRQIQW